MAKEAHYNIYAKLNPKHRSKSACERAGQRYKVGETWNLYDSFFPDEESKAKRAVVGARRGVKRQYKYPCIQFDLEEGPSPPTPLQQKVELGVITLIVGGVLVGGVWLVAKVVSGTVGWVATRGQVGG